MGGQDSSTPGDPRERLIAIGEIAAEVAHELRNALQIISANAFLAKQDPNGYLTYLEKIEANARVAHGIVDDLMGLARGEPAHAEPVRLAEVLLAARSTLPSAGAVFDDRFDITTFHVRAHVGLLSRIFHVLYENAIGASAPRTPTIATTATTDDARVVIDVSDDGPGVPDDVAPRIFEPLVTARAGGTGLGLALARRIAAAHGGSIELVRGSGGSNGATFRLELPF